MNEYPESVDVDLSKSRPSYKISVEETDLLIYLHGVDIWRVRAPFARVYGVACEMPDGSYRNATGVAEGSNVVQVFVQQGDTMALIHEFGHAIHTLMYPESIYWPKTKCEAFAFLADMRAMRYKVGLTAPARKMIAEHIRGTRREGFQEHKDGLKLAWRAVWSSNKLKEQREFIVNA
jgi:hypothetical protein